MAAVPFILTASLKQCQPFLGQTGAGKRRLKTLPAAADCFFTSFCKKMQTEPLQTKKLVLSCFIK